MIKDYSQLPANKRIVNDKDEDITISLRDKCIMVPVTIKVNESLSVKATTSEDLALINKQCEEFELPLEDEGPDITDIVVTITPNIREGEDNSKANATIATLSLKGGTEPVEYTLSGTDADKFILENNIVKAKNDLVEGTYSITLSALDSTKETYSETDEINVLAAYPLITDATISFESDIREGESNAAVGSVVGTIQVVGGTEPFTIQLSGTNSDKLEVVNNEIKAKQALTEGQYDIEFNITDTNNKTFSKSGSLVVLEAYPLITNVEVNLTQNLREGESNVAANAQIGTIETTGGTSPISYTIEGTNASSFVIDESNLKVGDAALLQGTYNITIKATDTHNKTFSKEVQISVAEAFPEITSIKISKTSNLREGENNVNSGAVVATLQTVGGTQPFVYTLSGTDESSFIIDNASVKVGSAPLTEKTYNITIAVEDANGKTFSAPTTIEVLEAYPAITDITVELTPNLREGEDNVKSGAKIADLAAVGGTEMFSWTVQGNEAGNFTFSNRYDRATQLKVNGPALTAGQHKVTVKVVDNNAKVLTKEITIDVAEAYPEISDITISLEDDIREGETNAQAGAVVGTISTTGGTEPITYSIPAQYGTKIVVDGSNLKVGSAPLTEDTYSFSVKATDVHNKTFTKAAELVVLAAYPEITSFTVSPTGGLEEGNANVQADAVVATMSVEGGSAPITYSFKEDELNGADNASFKIDGANLKVNTTPLVTKEYKVSLTATDTHGKTKDQTATITVTAPNITSLNAQLTSGLEEGNENVAANAKIADLSTTGGIAPYTYSLNTDEVNGVDNANFKVEGTQLKVNTTPLVKKDYKVSLKVTDKNNKTATKNITVSVGTPAISALNITPVESLQAPLAENTVVANLSSVGGIAPYTYSLKADTQDNAEFTIEGTTVKNIASIDTAGTKNITVVVTDKNSSTKEQTAQIEISAAGE